MSETLAEEKERLLKRLEFLNVNSVGRERIVERLHEINRTPVDEREGGKERFIQITPPHTSPTITARI